MRIIIAIILIPIIINFISISTLIIKKNYVAKVYFTPYFAARINTDTNDIEVFKTYMDEKGDKKQEILLTNIKTIIVDK